MSRGHCGVPPAEGSVGSLVWEEVRGESRRKHGPSVHHLKGAQPQELSGKSPYSENNWQKFSPDVLRQLVW